MNKYRPLFTIVPLFKVIMLCVYKKGLCLLFLFENFYIDNIFFFFLIHSRHVSDYLKVQERDPKAHKFLGQLFEREGEINKAVGCYRV